MDGRHNKDRLYCTVEQWSMRVFARTKTSSERGAAYVRTNQYDAKSRAYVTSEAFNISDDDDGGLLCPSVVVVAPRHWGTSPIAADDATRKRNSRDQAGQPPSEDVQGKPVVDGKATE